MSVCTLKQNIGGTSCGFETINRTEIYLDPTRNVLQHILIGWISQNEHFPRKYHRWALYFSQGGRRCYPVWFWIILCSSKLSQQIPRSYDDYPRTQLHCVKIHVGWLLLSISSSFQERYSSPWAMCVPIQHCLFSQCLFGRECRSAEAERTLGCCRPHGNSVLHWGIWCGKCLWCMGANTYKVR